MPLGLVAYRPIFVSCRKSNVTAKGAGKTMTVRPKWWSDLVAHNPSWSGAAVIIAILLMIAANHWRIHSESPPPRITSMTIAPNCVVGRPIELSASAVDSSEKEITTFAWSVNRDGRRIAQASGGKASFTLTETEAGQLEVQLTVTDKAGRTASMQKLVRAMTPGEFDQALTKALLGKWREDNDQAFAIFDLQQDSVFTADVTLTKQGIGDQFLSSVSDGVGKMTGKWWVKDGAMCTQVRGTETEVGTAMMRLGAAIKSLFGSSERAASAGIIISVSESSAVMRDSETSKTVVWNRVQ